MGWVQLDAKESTDSRIDVQNNGQKSLLVRYKQWKKIFYIYQLNFNVFQAIFDEGAQFSATLGRYSKDGKGEYERSIYNSLWNTPESFTRDLKDGNQAVIINAHLNLVTAMHVPQLLNWLAGN